MRIQIISIICDSLWFWSSFGCSRANVLRASKRLRMSSYFVMLPISSNKRVVMRKSPRIRGSILAVSGVSGEWVNVNSRFVSELMTVVI